jgi:DNA polymerase-3 subunit alpha
MAFCKIEDFTGTIEVVVFPKTYQRVHDLIASDSIVYVSGKVDEKENQMTILTDDIRTVDASS